jgi:hypothetical protein
MSETIVLDQPEQIAAWYILSMHSRCKMQMRGFKSPGLIRVLNERGLTTKKTASGAKKDLEAIMKAHGIQFTP